LPSLRYMRLQTFIPLLIHTGEPHSALVIGLGTGITAGAMLRYPGLDVRVCDELLPGVIRSTKLFEGNFDVASAPGIEIRHRDGRRDLLQRQQRYDVITLEPPPPSAAGVVNLYSSDFYTLAAKRLEPGGIFAQWFPIATQNDEDSRSLVRSFLDVFPYATLWTTELHEMLLVGSLQPIDLDMNSIAARFDQPQVAQALREVGIESPAALMATWVTDRDGLERYAGDALPVTDNRPRIEYATWVRRGEIMRALPELLSLRTAPPLHNADESLWNEVTEKRDQLFSLYGAGLAAYSGDRERWARIIASSGGPDMNNPYYRWLLGGDSSTDAPRGRP
jgi:spermidine synthase